MNDNDIIKALRCCKDNVLGCCDNCPMIDKEPTEWDECQRNIMGKALELICSLQSKVKAQEMDIWQLRNDVINANCNLDHITMQLECERAEAIKEFAEKLKGCVMKCTEYDEGGWDSTIYAVKVEDIQSLAKEMTEGQG